jgi:hypothetical protein
MTRRYQFGNPQPQARYAFYILRTKPPRAKSNVQNRKNGWLGYRTPVCQEFARYGLAAFHVTLRSMKTLFAVLTATVLVCGCHTNRDTGASTTYSGSTEGSLTQTNSRSGAGINSTNLNTQGSGADTLKNSNR